MAKQTIKTIFRQYRVIIKVNDLIISHREIPANDPLSAMNHAMQLLSRFTDDRQINNININWKELP